VIVLQNINQFYSIFVDIITTLELVTTKYVALFWFEFGQPSSIDLKFLLRAPTVIISSMQYIYKWFVLATVYIQHNKNFVIGLSLRFVY